MDSVQLIGKKGRKRKKVKKVPFKLDKSVTKRLYETDGNIKAHSSGKKRKQDISEKRKNLLFQRKKRKISDFPPSTVINEISSGADIENVAMRNNKEEFSVPQNKKTSDCRNIQSKRKHPHSDFPSTKNPKNKKDMRPLLNFNNEHKNCQKMETRNFSESDSDEDKILRCEIENMSFYKNIQNLIKNCSCLQSSISCLESSVSDLESSASCSKSAAGHVREESAGGTESKNVKQLKKDINGNVSLKTKSGDCINSKTQIKRKQPHSNLVPSGKNTKHQALSYYSNNKSKNDPKKETENCSKSDSNEDQVFKKLEDLPFYKDIQNLIKDCSCLDSSAALESSLDEKLCETITIRSSNEFVLEDCVDASGGSKEIFKTIAKDKLGSTSNKRETVVATGSTASSCFNRTKVNKNKKFVSTAGLANKDGKGFSHLKNKALEKLQGAKFRYLNEKLYTESGRDSFNYFQKNQEEFIDYHKGYSLQVSKWPLNPVDKIINSLQKIKKNSTIADMGCGDAKIARTLSNCVVHSFDLVALNKFVTPCNISKVPLSNESVDVVVFCLSLMGTNLKEYLHEAYRIAKFDGILKIAEVESRIPNLEQFVKSIESVGFSLEKKDVEHKMFVFLNFKKVRKNKKGPRVQDITLKPCLYKKR